MYLTPEEYDQIMRFKREMDTADTIDEVKKWANLGFEVIDDARIRQDESQQLVIKLYKHELEEYQKCLKNIDTAETNIEINAWAERARQIIDSALKRS